MPVQDKAFMSFHDLVFYFSISRECDVSKKIMSRPTRHEMPQNVLEGDMTSYIL